MIIEIDNWVKITINDCPVPNCPHCLAVPYHHQFDGRVGKLHMIIEDCEGDDYFSSQMDIPLECHSCKKFTGHPMSTSVQGFGHKFLVDIDGIHTRFSSGELEDLGESLEEYILKEAIKVLT